MASSRSAERGPVRRTLQQIAGLVGGTVAGNEAREVVDVATLQDAGGDHLSFLGNPKYVEQARSSSAGALLVRPADVDRLRGKNLIVVDDPHAALRSLLPVFRPPRPRPVGISEAAVLGHEVTLGENVAIGAGVVVGDRVRLGDEVVLQPGVVVGDDVEIGARSTLHPNVVVYPGCRLGQDVILHAGVVVGGDGFGYASDRDGHHKIPQVGVVVIEDDVEVGANSTIDRGALGDTIVGRGTRIDNLVMIAHGVEIGKNAIVVAQAGVAGSARLEDWVTLAGQSGVVGHVTIGQGATVAGKSVAAADLEGGQVYAGFPAVPHREWRRREALLRHIGDLNARVKELERQFRKITATDESPEETR